MASKFHGDCKVPIRLDVNRHILFDYRAYSKFQKVAGISINTLFERANEAQEKFPLPEIGEPGDELLGKRGRAFFTVIGDDMIPVLLWAGLIHEDKALTLEDVEESCQYAEGDSFDTKKIWLLGRITEAVLLSKGITPDSLDSVGKKKSTEDPPSSMPPSS